MNNKAQELLKYSNPNEVQRLADELFDNIPYDLALSTRKNKKYMIRGEFTNNKWIHFGEMGYEDYTKHKDEERRDKFLSRNRAWRNMPADSPAFLSYQLLW